MSDERHDAVEREDLRFFGKVSASISHEIKNVFAVIHAGAGLLEDLSLLAAKGRPLEPEKLQQGSGSILRQIQRGDEIVRNMNTFAHSVDEDVRNVDVSSVLELMVKISQRLAAARNVRLELGECRSCPVRTDPYFLEHLLFGVIELAVAHASSGSVVTFTATPLAAAPDQGARLSLSGARIPAELPEGLERLTRRLAACAASGDEAGTWVLRLPQTVSQDSGRI
jgi:signal transduction histidine kinase